MMQTPIPPALSSTCTSSETSQQLIGLDTSSSLLEYKKHLVSTVCHPFPFDYHALSGGNESVPHGAGNGYMMRAGVSITPSVVQQYRLNRAKRWNCVPNQRGLVKWTKYDDAEEEREIRASKCMVLKYSDAEYALLCQVPEWTRKETDLLIELCEEYQVRFFVIWDRWVSRIEQGNNKTIEDLKDRYYKVQKALIRYKCGEGVESVASQQRHEENGMDKENDFELDIDDRHGESDLQLNASLSSISIDNPLFSVEYDVNADKRRKEELKKVFERDENDVVKAMHLVLQNRDIDKKLRAMSSDEKRKQQIYELFHTLVIVASSMFSDAEDEANSPRRGGSPSPMKRARWRKNKVDLFGGDPSQLSELLSGIPSEAVHRNIFKPKAKGTYLRSTWPQDLPNASRKLIMSIDERIEHLNIGSKIAQSKWSLYFNSQLTCLMFDLIRREICTLNSLLRIVQRKEQEKRIIEAEMNSLTPAAVKTEEKKRK